MLLNSQSPIPETFYIFVNRNIPITLHNITFTKTLFSGAIVNCSLDSSFLSKYMNGTARYAPYEPCETDLRAFSPYCVTAINDYRVEYEAEWFRREYYPLYPSRFSAVFAFGEFETCQEVAKKHKWNLDEVHKFKIREVTDLTRVIKVNMEIISLARHAYRISSQGEGVREFIWKNYWEGSGDIALELPGTKFQREIRHSGEIFEYLIEGYVVLEE
jgi:hypothetical protein